MSENIKQELANWLDKDVIAEAILEEMEESGIEGTLENAKATWLSFLTAELHDGLKRSIFGRFLTL